MSLSFTFLDCLIVFIVLLSVIYVAWRGFIWETLTIFSWVSAAFACLYFGPYVIPLMRGMVGETWFASLLAYTSVFLAVFIPVAFGIVRGLVFVGLAYLAFSYFVPLNKHPEWIRNARLLPIVQSTSQVLLTVVPDHPEDFAYIPHHEEVKQAPAKIEQKAANSPDMSPGMSSGHDPMADLIRKNEASNHVPAATPEPVRQQKT